MYLLKSHSLASTSLCNSRLRLREEITVNIAAAFLINSLFMTMMGQQVASERIPSLVMNIKN